jgi:uncharacterized protein YkwD
VRRPTPDQRSRPAPLGARAWLGRWTATGLLVLGLAGTLVPVAISAHADGNSGTAVSAFEETLLARINAERRKAGARPLSVAKGLMTAATSHARSMARDGYFAHTSSDGSTPSSRIRRFYDGRKTGETLLWRAPDLTPAAAVQMWLGSPPHRAVLLSADFREIGLAAIHLREGTGTFGDGPVTIVVVDVGAR